MWIRCLLQHNCKQSSNEHKTQGTRNYYIKTSLWRNNYVLITFCVCGAATNTNYSIQSHNLTKAQPKTCLLACMLHVRNSSIKVKGAYLISNNEPMTDTLCAERNHAMFFFIWKHNDVPEPGYHQAYTGPTLAHHYGRFARWNLYIPGGTLQANKKSLMSGMSSLYVMLGRGELPPGSTSSSPPEESLQPPESHLHHIDQPHEMGHGQHLDMKIDMDGVLGFVFEICQPHRMGHGQQLNMKMNVEIPDP